MDLNLALNQVQKAVNTFKALKEIEEVIDVVLKAESLAKEQKAASTAALAELAKAKQGLADTKATYDQVIAGNAKLVQEAKDEAAAIASKAKADAVAVVAGAKVKLEATQKTIAEQEKVLFTIKAQIKDTEAVKVEKAKELAALQALIETTKAQFKAIGG